MPQETLEKTRVARRETCEKSLSQFDAARLFNISRAQYSHFETGRRKPSVELAKKIGKEFKFNWTIFFE